MRLRSLPATWMCFSVLDPVIFHNSLWHKQYLPCCRVRYIRVQNTEKGLEKCSKHPPARFFTFQFLLFSNTCRVLPYILSYIFDLNIDHWEIKLICYRTWASVFDWGGLVEGRLPTFGGPVIFGGLLLLGSNWGHNLSMILSGGVFSLTSLR